MATMYIRDTKCDLGYLFFFFFNVTATTEIYTLSLHDALPIYIKKDFTKITDYNDAPHPHPESFMVGNTYNPDIQSAKKLGRSYDILHKNIRFYNTSYSHLDIHTKVHAGEHANLMRSEEHTSELQSRETNSYAAFCLKKKKKQKIITKEEKTAKITGIQKKQSREHEGCETDGCRRCRFTQIVIDRTPARTYSTRHNSNW